MLAAGLCEALEVQGSMHGRLVLRREAVVISLKMSIDYSILHLPFFVPHVYITKRRCCVY